MDTRLDNFKKVMLLVWKWRHPNSTCRLDEAVDYDCWTVENEPDRVVIRMDPTRMEPEAEYIEKNIPKSWLEDSLLQIKDLLVKLDKSCSVQVHLHGTHGYGEAHKQVLENFKEENRIDLKCFVFQHQHSLLYIGPNSPDGLLGKFGNWGKTLIGIEGVVSAVADKDNKILRQKSFNFVWDHYDLGLLPRTCKLNEDIIIKLHPLEMMTASPDMTKYEVQTKAVKSAIDLYLTDFGTQLPESLRRQLEDLNKFLPEKLPEKGLLAELRSTFEAFSRNQPGNSIHD